MKPADVTLVELLRAQDFLNWLIEAAREEALDLAYKADLYPWPEIRAVSKTFCRVGEVLVKLANENDPL